MPADDFARSLITLLAILDPLGNIPVFLALTGAYDPKSRHRAAYIAVLTAGLVLVVFGAFGQILIKFLSISLESLMVAGGVLLFFEALQLLRGGAPDAPAEEASVALVPLGTPLLAGPGAIVATIVLLRQTTEPGVTFAVGLGIFVALLLTLGALRFAATFGRFVSPSIISFVTRIMGLILTAIAVQLIVDAIDSWMRHGLS